MNQIQGPRRHERRHGDAGAVLVEYALVIALLVVGSIGTIRVLDQRTREEVDQEALCISTRPPPPDCQVRAVTTSTTIIGPPTSNSTTTTSAVVADLTWESSAAVPLDPPGSDLFDLVTSPQVVIDDIVPQPIAGVNVRVEVFIVLPAPESGPFFMDCTTDATGRCELRFTTPAPGIDRVEFRNPTVTGYPGQLGPIPPPPTYDLT